MSSGSELSERDTPRRSLGVKIRRTREGLLIGVGPDTLLLSDSAEFIYRQLDGIATVRQLAQRVCEQYQIDENEAFADAQELLTQLEEQNVVQW